MLWQWLWNISEMAIQRKKNDMDVKGLFKRKSISDLGLLYFAFAFVLCFFAPLDFLYSNKNDLWLDAYNIISCVALITIITFLSMFVVGFLLEMIPKIGDKLQGIFFYVVIVVLISTYIQGNFIPIPYGAIDGSFIEWDAYKWENATSIVMWAGISLIMLIVYGRFGRIKFIKLSKTISLLICAIAVFTLVIEYGVGDGKEKKISQMSSTKNERLYSRDRNINILLLDYFDSRLFTEKLEDEDVLRWLDEYDGFTFYRDTMGCYNLTDYAIPSILTGELYYGDITYGEYAEKAYLDSALFNRLTEEGWNTNIYTSITLPQGKASGFFDNVSLMRLKPIYESKLYKDYYTIVGFRYAPTPLKRYFYNAFFEVGANRMAEYEDRSQQQDDLIGAYDWDNILWINEMQHDFELTDDKVFHFYHVHGVHPPRQYDSDFNFTTDPNKVDLEEGAKFNLRIVRTWIERMKEEGVYDNSVLIVMADHGSWEYEDGHYLSQTPLLLIKGYDEHHELQISDMPISHTDMQGAFQRLMNGEKGVNVFSDILTDYGLSTGYTKTYTIEEFKNRKDASPERVGRVRSFYFTYLMNEMGTDSVGGPFYEGVTEYPAYEPDYMIRTGNIFE